MRSVLLVTMLSAFALVLLVFGATDGRIVGKCELKEQLEAAKIEVIKAMGDRMAVVDLIARLVCKANATGFNTSFVKTLTANPKPLNIVPQNPQRPPWHLYGLFQLSDQWACDSGMTASLNVCNISCSAFTDDDVTDDIACLKTVINSIKPRPKLNPFEITLPLAVLNNFLVKECRFIDPSEYFFECLTPTLPVAATSLMSATSPLNETTA